MTDQTPEPIEQLAGLPLYHKILNAITDPTSVVGERGNVYGRGGGKESAKSHQGRAVIHVLEEHRINPHTTFAPLPALTDEELEQAKEEFRHRYDRPTPPKVMVAENVTAGDIVDYIRSRKHYAVMNDGLGTSYLIERGTGRTMAEVTAQVKEAKAAGLIRFNGLVYVPVDPA